MRSILLCGSNAKASEAVANPVHRLDGTSEEVRASDSNKPPPKPLQYGLSRHVLSKILQGVMTVTVTFKRHSLAFAMDDEINNVRPDSVLRCHNVPPLQEVFQNALFEFARSSIHSRAQPSPFRDLGLRADRVFDQSPSQISVLQVDLLTEGIDYPHLIASATRGDVESFLESVVAPHGQNCTLWCIDHTDEYNVSLVTLKLRRIATHDAMSVKLGWRQPSTQLGCDVISLFFANHRDHADGRVGVLRFIQNCDD